MNKSYFLSVFAILAFMCCSSQVFAHRDLDTGEFITKDPAGFVDGPNLYTYVRQNPWTSFDPEGLETWDQKIDKFSGKMDSAYKKIAKFEANANKDINNAESDYAEAINQGLADPAPKSLSGLMSQYILGAQDAIQGLAGHAPKDDNANLYTLIKRGEFNAYLATPFTNPRLLSSYATTAIVLAITGKVLEPVEGGAPEGATAKTTEETTQGNNSEPVPKDPSTKTYYREGDSPENIENIKNTGKLYGNPTRFSNTPTVNARGGLIPEHLQGFEFESSAVPDSAHEGFLTGIQFSPGNEGVIINEQGQAQIDVNVTKIQNPRASQTQNPSNENTETK